MDIINRVNHTSIDKTLKPDRLSKDNEPKASSVEGDTAASRMQTEQNANKKDASPVAQPQVQTRTINFRLDHQQNKIFVEVKNADGDLIRTIPEDEKDPAFREIIADLKPGTIVDDRQ